MFYHLHLYTNLGVSLIPFDQVGLAQRISVGLRSRIELHGILEIVDSTIEDVISRLAESSQSFIRRHNGITSVVACMTRYAAVRQSFDVKPLALAAKPACVNWVA